MSPEELLATIRARLDKIERWANEASSDRGGRTEGGEHWRWECSDCDMHIPITDVTVLDGFVECPGCESGTVALRSVEEYPTTSVGTLPHFVLAGVEELRPVDAGYLLLFAPAAVLLQVEGWRLACDMATACWISEDPADHRRGIELLFIAARSLNIDTEEKTP